MVKKIENDSVFPETESTIFMWGNSIETNTYNKEQLERELILEGFKEKKLYRAVNSSRKKYQKVKIRGS